MSTPQHAAPASTSADPKADPEADSGSNPDADPAQELAQAPAQLAQRLTELRAAPGFEQQALAAWRGVLGAIAQGDFSLLAPKLATVAQLKKRCGLGEAGACLLAQWLQAFSRGDGLRRLPQHNAVYWTPERLQPVAQALLADARLAGLEAQAAAAHAAQWADLPSAAQRDEGRFAQTAIQPPLHLPLWPDDAQVHTLLATWREQTHTLTAHGELQAELDAWRATLDDAGAATPALDAFWLAMAQTFDVHADAVLLQRHGLPGTVQRLLLAMGRHLDTRWHHGVGIGGGWALSDTGSPDAGWRMDHLCCLREHLRQASAPERAACEELMLAGLAHVPVMRRQYLAVLLPQSQALAQAVLASEGFELASHGRWLAASAVDEATQAQVPLGTGWEWHRLPDWVRQLLLDGASPLHPNSEGPQSSQDGQPDTLALALRAANNKSAMQEIELMQARWPLAMLIAATRVAVSTDRQAPAALGLVRSGLAELGAAHALARPWLTPAAWRWLHTQAQPQADLVRANVTDLPAVLLNPPWLKKRAKGEAAHARTVLTLPTLPLADALNWTRLHQPDLPIAHSVAEPMKLAYRLRVNQWDKDQAYVEVGGKAIAAGDANALIAAWRKPLTKPGRYAYGDALDGKDIGKLPTALAVPFWNAMASELTIYESEHVMDRWGEAALPGLLAHFGRCPSCKNDYWTRTGAVSQASESARMLFRTKAPAQRQRGQQWLLAWPEHAATGLLPAALGPDGAAQVNAALALRLLAAHGQRERLAAVAARYAQPEVLAALNALLDQDPLEQHPAKVAKLPEFWQPQQWNRPRLRPPRSLASRSPLPPTSDVGAGLARERPVASAGAVPSRSPTPADAGAALPDAAIDALGQMLSFARPAGVYAGLAQVIAACTPASLADFAWDLFSAWLAAGAPAKDNWAFTALGLLGNEHAVHRLAPLMRAWPGEGNSARATTGLLAMAELGTDSALRLVADLTGDKVPKGLRTKAQDLLAQAAEARGLSLPDLEDRLVPGLDLDARGQTVLDYGPRQFLLALDENLKPWLRKLEGGKPGARIRSLPVKNAADDPEQAQWASERFKAIKTQAEGVAKVQIKRLEQAMVTGRRWQRADFEALYVQQPLLRQLASRLIWGVFEDASNAANGPGAPGTAHAADTAALQAANPRGRAERLLQALRLSDDGELSTSDDAPWVWPSTAEATGTADAADAAASEPSRLRLGLVHPLELDAAEREALAQLLADYELMQPFEQLARQASAVPAAEREARVAALAAQRYSPGRLLALKTRGWQLANHEGYAFNGALRTVGDDTSGNTSGKAPALQVSLHVSPGVDTYEVRKAPPQQLVHLKLLAGDQAVGWERLDTLAFSEVLREMAYLAL